MFVGYEDASLWFNIEIPALRSRTSTSVRKVVSAIFISGSGAIAMRTKNLGKSRRVSFSPINSACGGLSWNRVWRR